MVNGTTESAPINNAPIANASDISEQPEIMYPDTDYSVTAKYYDPDGRDDLQYCYLQLKHPTKNLTMMWYQSDGHADPWAGEQGENYLTINDVTSTTITDGYEGYQLTWNFTINENWPEAKQCIDFGVCAKDDSGVSSGFDYNNSDASFFTIPNPPDKKLGQFAPVGKYEIPVGGKTFEDDVTFKGTVSNPGGSKVKLQLELKKVGEEFSNEPTHEGTLVNSGTETAVNVTDLGLEPGDYHWQARTQSEYEVNSTWVKFGGNTDPDFTVPLELALAKKFSPVLYIDSEDYQPTDVRIVVDNAALGKATFVEKLVPWTLTKLWDVESTEVLDDKLSMEKLLSDDTFPFADEKPTGWFTKQKKGYFFDLPGDPTNAGDDQYSNAYNSLKDQHPNQYPNVSYARITEGWNRTTEQFHVILQYYFVYYYNHWPLEEKNSLGYDWDDHEWDCEVIELIFPAGMTIPEILGLIPPFPPAEPDSAVYSAHAQIPFYSYGAMKADWNEVGKTVGNHPKVYVGRGGHPNYFTSGTYSWKVGKYFFGNDIRPSDAVEVTPHVILLPKELKAGEKYREEDNLNKNYWWPGFGWAKYEGRWGEVDKDLTVHEDSFPTGLARHGYCGYKLVTHRALTNPWEFYQGAKESTENPVREKILGIAIQSPVSVGVYDAEGHHVGPNETGVMEFEIPGAAYIASEDTHSKLIIIPNADISDNYTVAVNGTDAGIFNLSVVIADQGSNVQHVESYENVSVNLNATGKVELNPKTNFTLHMDYDGDGVYETDVPPTEEETINVTKWPTDITPPANITDLHVTGATAESLTLNWTAPGNDGYSGTAMAYELRYSTSPMTEESWYSAIGYPDAPLPQAGNTTEVCTVYGLEPGTTYYFALMAADDEWNWGGLSNIAEGTTLGATLQGHVSFPTARVGGLIEPFVVKGFKPGNLSNVLWTGSATTNDTGVFTIPGLAPDIYDISIKNATCLSELVTNVTLTAGETEVVNFTIREGDVHSDDYVDMGDYADFSYAFRTSPSDAKWNANADLDRSGYIDMGDYAMFSYNFREIGDAYGYF